MKNYYQNPILTGSTTFEQRESLVEQGKKDGTFYPPIVGEIFKSDFLNGFKIITAYRNNTLSFAEYGRRDGKIFLWNENGGRHIECFYDDALHGAVKQLETEDLNDDIREIYLKVLDDLIMKSLKSETKDVTNAAEWCRLQKRREAVKNQLITA